MNDATCDDLQRSETAAVADWLQREARRQPPRDGLPSASHLWWRAQIIRDLVERETAVERATRPVRWLQVVALGALGLAIALALRWLTASLLGGLETQVAGATVSLRWLGGLLLAGTVVPLAGFAALWLLWREA